MLHIREYLRRERQRLLDEFGAPDFATLLRRALFWVRFYVTVSVALIGILMIGNYFGLVAMWAVVVVLLLLGLQMESKAPAYMYDHWPDQTLLPPNRRNVLPGSRIDTTPRLTSRSRTGRSLPPPG
jgi:hypothetical protein